MASSDRDLDWRGCFNARDLGGLPIATETVRRSSLVRSDSLASLTRAGWSGLEGYGIQTVIDLRNMDEIGSDASPRPRSVRTVNLPLDVIEDRVFWDRWESRPEAATPLYFGPHLERFPDRHAAVIAEIAAALPSGASPSTASTAGTAPVWLP